MNKRLTRIRLILAIVSTGLEEVAIWAIWARLLPDIGINWPWQILVVIIIAWAAFCTWLFIFTTQTLKKQSQAGQSSMVGVVATVAKTLNPEGQVKIRGELWGAVSESGNIAAGEEVIVVGENGLKLTVRKINSAEVKR
jgi:membrane-bound ClpP family serine protease